jgi:hypothetical protein
MASMIELATMVARCGVGSRVRDPLVSRQCDGGARKLG